MSAQQSSPYQRIFSTQHWFKTIAWRVYAWAVVAAILLIWQVFSLYLIIDLFNSGGSLTLNTTERESLVSLVGEDFVPPHVEIGTDPSGILPSVWSARNRPWAAPLASAYRNISILRENNTALMVLLFLIVFLGILISWIRAHSRRISVKVAQDTIGAFRRRIHRQTLRLGPSDLDDEIPEKVVDLFTKGMDKIRDGLIERIYCKGFFPIILGALILIALLINLRLALQCIIPLFACWYFIRKEYDKGEQSMILAKSLMGRDLRLLSESLHKTRLVRGYGMEEFEQAQFQSNLDRYQTSAAKVLRQKNNSMWLIRLLILLCFTIILYLVGMKVLLPASNELHMRLSTAIVFGICFAAMYRPLERLRSLTSIRREVNLVGNQLFRYLNQVPEVGQAVGAKFLEPLSKFLHYDQVTYSLPSNPDRKLLDDVSLQVPAHEVTAIISTEKLEAKAMAFMLPRFIEPQKGRIMFDAEDIAWVTLESLRAETTLIGENDPFFTGSVLENIVCGNSKFSLTEATEAAKLVHAHHFIQKLHLGYETILGEHGDELEPGQAFRLSLARAALRNPALMVICEPEAQFDADTKNMIDDAYSRLFKKRTVIILPTRLSTIRRAKNIIFVHQGKIEAAGSHTDLINKSSLYRHWEYTQFNVFRHEQG